MKDKRCCVNCFYCEKEEDFQGEYRFCGNEDSPKYEVEVFEDTVCPMWDGEWDPDE